MGSRAGRPLLASPLRSGWPQVGIESVFQPGDGGEVRPCLAVENLADDRVINAGFRFY